MVQPQLELIVSDEADEYGMTVDDYEHADYLDSIVQNSSESLWEALEEIRDKRLYRKWFGTFEDYCQDRVGRGRNYVNKQIRSVEIIERLGTIVPNLPTPANEAQLRPLTRLDPDDQADAWREAVARGNGQPTAKMVEQVVRERKPPVVTPQDVASVIKNGAQQVIDHAKQQWYSNAYQMDDKAQQENLDRWRAIENTVAEVATPAKLAPLMSSASPEWYTPQHIIERVIKTMGGINLDPCSNSDDPTQANVKADRYYTEAIDGLEHEWSGKVYMNPPYGDVIGDWVSRLIHQVDMDITTEAIALLPGRIDTAWFRPLWRQPICFLYGRLKFSGADNSAPFPSAVVYFGNNVEGFYKAFSDIGHVNLPISINQWLKHA